MSLRQSAVLALLAASLLSFAPAQVQAADPSAATALQPREGWYKQLVDFDFMRANVDTLVVTGAETDMCVLATVLGNAVRAPSAGFSQGWDFVVLRTAAEREIGLADQVLAPARRRGDERADALQADLLHQCLALHAALVKAGLSRR